MIVFLRPRRSDQGWSALRERERVNSSFEGRLHCAPGFLTAHGDGPDSAEEAPQLVHSDSDAGNLGISALWKNLKGRDELSSPKRTPGKDIGSPRESARGK